MQISSLREYYGCGLRSHLAVLDARTTNAVPALYVPEKLNRGERQITRPRRITLARRDARPAPWKNRFVAEANEAVIYPARREALFVLRRNGGVIASLW